jgi:nucleotide-binding universal stress UspA family protein
VLILSRAGGNEMKKILVTTDGSADSDKAIDMAIEVAKKDGAEIIVLNVAEDYCPIGLAEMDCDTIREIVMKESKGIMSAALEKFKAAGITARGIIERGRPADTIIEVIKREKVDEVIMASHGKHGAKKIVMGSVTARVVEWAPCPVTVVK